MKLLLDIGNTRVKWAFLSGGVLQQPGELVHRGKSIDRVRELFQHLPTKPEQAAMVNVAGDAVAKAIAASLAERWGISLRRISSTAQWGQVQNGYTDCTQLGADRWAAIVGAWQQYQADLCVVDAGTAVTIDLVRADGRHLGGVILAGRELAQTALRGETADIAEFANRKPGPGDRNWFGRSTAEAISRGAEFGLCAAVDEAVKAFPGNGDESVAPLVVLTGGDAEILLPNLTSQCQLHPHLVLEGLAILAGGADA